jgi:hypothetical protein
VFHCSTASMESHSCCWASSGSAPTRFKTQGELSVVQRALLTKIKGETSWNTNNRLEFWLQGIKLYSYIKCVHNAHSTK